MALTDPNRRFEAATLPHLDAAYNLARWLLRDDQPAQDAVQEAFLRALRFFDQLRGDDARPWLLGIVRNTCNDWLRQRQRQGAQVEFDEGLDGVGMAAADPAELSAQRSQGERVNSAISRLAPAFREVIVLRELEECSYDEIALIAGIPVGTVMSRLSRARALLREALSDERK